MTDRFVTSTERNSTVNARTHRPLDQLQQWFQTVMTHPAGIERGVSSHEAREALGETINHLDAILPPSRSLSSHDRMKIYGNAYFTRLLECLRVDFPTIVRVLGQDAFDGLAVAYLVERPSRSYTLAELGSGFVEFLNRPRDRNSEPANIQNQIKDIQHLDSRELRHDSSEPRWGSLFDSPTAPELPRTHDNSGQYGAGPLGQTESNSEASAFHNESESQMGCEEINFADFLIDLARLERTYHDVFHCRGPENARSIEKTDIERINPAEIGQSRIRFHECVRLLRLQYPVHELVSQVRNGMEFDYSHMTRRSVNLVVTRREYIVRRFEVTVLQWEFLNALQTGLTIEEAIVRASSVTTLEPTSLRNWFFEWTAAQLFQGIESAQLG